MSIVGLRGRLFKVDERISLVELFETIDSDKFLYIEGMLLFARCKHLLDGFERKIILSFRDSVSLDIIEIYMPCVFFLLIFFFFVSHSRNFRLEICRGAFFEILDSLRTLINCDCFFIYDFKL